MDRSSRTDEEDLLAAQRPKGGPDFHVEVRVVARVHGYDCGWWASVGKHADED